MKSLSREVSFLTSAVQLDVPSRGACFRTKRTAKHLHSRRKRPSVLVMCGPDSNRLVIHFGRRLMVKGTLLDKPSGKLS